MVTMMMVLDLQVQLIFAAGSVLLTVLVAIVYIGAVQRPLLLKQHVGFIFTQVI